MPTNHVPPVDVAVLSGSLSSDPEVVVLASGSTLYRYQVTVRGPEWTESVPVAWIDPGRPPSLTSGDQVVVVGRVRRRFFRAGGGTRSAVEVDATAVVPASRRAAVGRAVGPVLAALAEIGGD